MSKKKVNSSMPRILVLDIETAPLAVYTWGIWEQNIGLNQIKDDWNILSWAALWRGDPPSKIMYMDQRKEKDYRNDKKIITGIWKLIDEADILLTQNGISFDIKKLNARFIEHGLPPPSSYRHIDTKRLAKKTFAFTSNSLEFMTEKFCTKYKKLKHKDYAGFSLWLACMAGDKKAWKEMERYNKNDVLSTNELYDKLSAWDTSINYSVYSKDHAHVCSCGSREHKENGYRYTSAGKYKRFKCKSCGRESQGRINLLSKEKKKSPKPE